MRLPSGIRFRTLPAVVTLLAVVALTACNDAFDDNDDPGGVARPRTTLDSLELSARRAVADGRSAITVTAHVTAHAGARDRWVKFYATGGDFAAGEARDSTLVVPLSSDGRAVATLIAPGKAGLVTIQALAGETVETDTIRFESPAPARLLGISTSRESAVADSAELVAVRVRVPPDTGKATRYVTFTTSAGTFALDSAGRPAPSASTRVVLPVAADSTATALLRAPRTPGLALVQAAIEGSVLLDTVTFTRALPEFLAVTADRFTVRATDTTSATTSEDSATIIAYLRRSQGLVSPGTSVQFTWRDTTGRRLGRLDVPTLSNDSAIVRVRYSPGRTDYRGVVWIVGSTMGQNGATLRDSVSLDVRAP